MVNLSMLILLSIIISGVIMIISFIIMKTSELDREKMTPFECGFDPKYSSRTPFSLQFFLITIIFLVFDVEVTLLLPTPLLLNSTFSSSMVILLYFFVFILLGGLYYEWKQGMLDWNF